MAKCGHGGTVGDCDVCKQEKAASADRVQPKGGNEGEEPARFAQKHQTGRKKK